MNELTTGPAVFLLLALGLALAFEFVNGFHDTANAVATVIYTHTLPPKAAVAWSGLWNLLGVLASSGAVAFGIISLLPVELILNVGSAAGFAMVFAMLLSAISWNLGTWYLGLPASSSHTLIGSILGVGIANALMNHSSFGDGVNWTKAREVFLSLLISPVIGFFFSLLLVVLAKKLIADQRLFADPSKEAAPPPWIRSILFMTCTGVSFAHGSNDGQKGMGLILLILIGILPGQYALNLALPGARIQEIHSTAHAASAALPPASPVSDTAATTALSAFLKSNGTVTAATFPALAGKIGAVERGLDGVKSLEQFSTAARRKFRSDAYLVAESVAKLKKLGQLPTGAQAPLLKLRQGLDGATQHIPLWVKIAVALALSLGTMIGWERIVITVGEKIGKSHLTYAQGAAAEISAMTTIFAADGLGLPLSTTHVLSSGIAGTMLANRSGLQTGTLRNILLAWVLTLPVCVFLGAFLFALVLNVLLGLGL